MTFLQHRMAVAAAWLIFLGLATGGYAGLAMTGKLPADGHAALAAHLNALMGGFWILGVAWTLPMLKYGEVGLTRLAWAVIAPNYANWLITSVKAALKVPGLDFTGEAANDAVFVALNVAVVLPALAAAFFWARGFRRATP